LLTLVFDIGAVHKKKVPRFPLCKTYAHTVRR
jgi:hypothetical protein